MQKEEELINDKTGQELCESMKEKVMATVCNHEFIIYPNVFNPDFFVGPNFFTECLIKIIKEFYPKHPTLLDVGTGAGYVGILAILNGASHVTSIDINQYAIENAKENVKKYDLEEKIILLQSDIFDSIELGEKFDIIFWNIPFEFTDKPIQELSLIERSMYDPHFSLLDRYLKMAHKYMTPNVGRLFLGYSETYGSMDDFQRIASKHKLKINRLYNTNLFRIITVNIGLYELNKID
jgi:methylase of polypeptide subunit release factors